MTSEVAGSEPVNVELSAAAAAVQNVSAALVGDGGRQPSIGRRRRVPVARGQHGDHLRLGRRGRECVDATPELAGGGVCGDVDRAGRAALLRVARRGRVGRVDCDVREDGLARRRRRRRDDAGLVVSAAVRLDVLAQRRRVRVGLVAAGVAAVVRLVGRVHVRVLLAVRAVGEATLAADELASERLLACNSFQASWV